ncbi:MAG TPA: hypothetical protein ENI93_07650 [Gammaproteobacteria bacterium]|nr:hypothetical protein [Gammaproteobacteria bacterium]
MNRDYPVLIGAAGWRHPAWQGDFYPDDLPAEWQPVYYANEFPVVLIAATDLADAATLAGWREAGETGLRLLVELDDEGALAAGAGDLGEALAGWVLPAGDTASLEARLDALGPALPIVVDFGTGEPDPALAEGLAARGVGWCWHGEGDAGGLAHGELAVMRVSSSGAGPRDLRRWLEAGLAVQDGRRTVALVFEGTPPDITVLRQAQTLSELL